MSITNWYNNIVFRYHQYQYKYGDKSLVDPLLTNGSRRNHVTIEKPLCIGHFRIGGNAIV